MTEKHGLGEGSGVRYSFPDSGDLYRKSAYFRADEWEAVKQEARTSGESVSTIIRRAVQLYLLCVGFIRGDEQ